MDQQLYMQLKSIFAAYEFNDQANFYVLFKYAKKAGLRGLSFKQFCDHAKMMGISSSVARVDGLPKRSLIYNARDDQYIKTVFPQFETCPDCKGSGLIEIKLS